MQKLYCYVDESGQDTRGEVFIVSVVVVGKERDELLALCERIERKTRKGARKWRASDHDRRMAYMEQIFQRKSFYGVIRYATHMGKIDYDLATVTTIAKAVSWKQTTSPFQTLIYVDALTKKQRPWYGWQLTKYGVHNKKIRGIHKDENSALIRLADAVAGLLRDALAHKYPQATTLVNLGKKNGTLIEL